MISPASKTPNVPVSLKRWASKSELAIIIADPSGAVQWVNPAFTTICDYQLDEIIGMKPGHFLSGPLTEVRSRETLNHAIRDKKPCLVRITNYKKSGKPYIVEIHLEPIFNKKNDHQGFLSLERDVTEDEQRQRQYGELNASMYRQLLDRFEVVKAGAKPNS
jgi:PAS domain S-box-containing protein